MLSDNMSKRPTFYVNDDTQKPVRASGILFYKIISDKTYLLVISSKSRIEDFGGKTDLVDKSPLDTALREASEESNNLIDINTYRSRVDPDDCIYVPHAKYLLYFCRLYEHEFPDTHVFGRLEYCENIPRNIIYLDKSQLYRRAYLKKLNPRLKYKRKTLKMIRQLGKVVE